MPSKAMAIACPTFDLLPRATLVACLFQVRMYFMSEYVYIYTHTHIKTCMHACIYTYMYIYVLMYRRYRAIAYMVVLPGLKA